MLTKLFLTLALASATSLSLLGQMNFIEYYAESMERAEKYTLDLIEIMPEDKFQYKPVDEVNSFRDQVTHVIKNIGFLQSYITGKRDSPIRDLDLQDLSKEELLKSVKIAFDHLYTITNGLDISELETPVEFFAEGVRMDKRGILLLIKNHMTLHHGQLVVYLRLNGKTPPRFSGY